MGGFSLRKKKLFRPQKISGHRFADLDLLALGKNLASKC